MRFVQIKKRLARAATHVSDHNVRGAREVAPGAVVGSALTAQHRILDTSNPMACSGDRITTRDTWEAELRPEIQSMNSFIASYILPADGGKFLTAETMIVRRSEGRCLGDVD